jgi:hypothetical protein
LGFGEWPWSEVDVWWERIGGKDQGKESPAGPQRPCARLDISVAELLGQAVKDQSIDDCVEVALVAGRFREVGDTEFGA